MSSASSQAGGVVGIAIGIFDLFAYAIPGALYLSLLAYIANRAHWINAGELLTSPSVALLAAIVIAGFLVGQATYNLAELADRVNPFKSRDPVGQAKARFVARSGVAESRPYLNVHLSILQAAVELSNREVAAEIARLNATGLMLRNSVPPLLIAAFTAYIEVFTSSERLFAGTVGTLLLLLMAGCMWHSAKLRRWALAKTLELCYWVKDIDESIRAITRSAQDV
jgi:hypothetical protein